MLPNNDHPPLFADNSLVRTTSLPSGSPTGTLWLASKTFSKKSTTPLKAVQSSLLYWISFALEDVSRLPSQRDLHTSVCTPVDEGSDHRCPKKEPMSFRELE